MGHYLELDADTRVILQNATDDFIDVLGKSVTLYFAPIMKVCENCETDPVGGKSLHRWLTGGPIRFDAGSACPLCNGTGQFHAVEQSVTIKMHCSFNLKEDLKKFFYPVPNLNIRVPRGVIQTQGYLTDLPKVKRSTYAVFESEYEDIHRQKYTLVGDPVLPENIVQGRYFYCTWERQS